MPLLLSHMTEPPERPSARRPDIPGDIEEIILRLLSKKPADRYESCAQLKQALVEAFVASQRG